MHKSLGTNLHLWRFFKRAKQTVTREFIYTWSAPPPSPPPPHLQCWTRVHVIFPEFQHCIGGGGGKATQLKTDKSGFLNSVLKAQKINAIAQVSQGAGGLGGWGRPPLRLGQGNSPVHELSAGGPLGAS